MCIKLVALDLQINNILKLTRAISFTSEGSYILAFGFKNFDLFFTISNIYATLFINCHVHYSATKKNPIFFPISLVSLKLYLKWSNLISFVHRQIFKVSDVFWQFDFVLW